MDKLKLGDKVYYNDCKETVEVVIAGINVHDLEPEFYLLEWKLDMDGVSGFIHTWETEDRIYKTKEEAQASLSQEVKNGK